MRIIGCDFHASQQTIAMLDRETGDITTRTLKHEADEVRMFYAGLARPVLVGIEATGSMGWFLQLLDELAIAYQVGHPAKIREADTRRQKHDRRDAELLLQLLIEDRFPAIWLPTGEQRDVRALLLHRHQWVRLRTRVQHSLQAIALGQGVRRGASLWTRDGQASLAAWSLPFHAAYRRDALHALYRHLSDQIAGLDARVADQARDHPGSRLLMTHPGIGPVTALATDVFLGDPARFATGKAVASYVGMIPREYSSGPRQRLGALTKQGNRLLRFLWCEAALTATRRDLVLKRFYGRKLHQRGLGKARVAAARKLGIRLWIMLRDRIDYQEFCRRGSVRP